MNFRPLCVASPWVLACLSATSQAQVSTGADSRLQRDNSSYQTLIDGTVDKAAVSMNEATWAFFSIVRLAETKSPGDGAALMQNAVGLSAAQAAVVVSHVNVSWKDVSQASRQPRISACADSQALKTSRELFAGTLERFESISAQRREAAVAALPSLVGPEAAAKISAWVEENVRGHLKLVKTDWTKWSTGLRDSVSAVDRLCRSTAPALR